MDMIRLLEKALGKKAIIQDAGDSRGEIASTFADTSLAHQLVGYRPSVSLEEGIGRFVEWYRSDEYRESFAEVAT